jgi:Ca2+-transporting ATPase
VPEQKLRIVAAFKAAGEVVAMTGDGVNDAPALKAAHIGIAMGKRGTDVAREAAALVLLQDDFASIVHAVRLGRRIYDNIQKAMRYILAVHVPTAGMALLPLFFGWPLVLFPVHIVFLEFVIDPACSIAFEAEPGERDIMRRPPRSATARLLDWRTVASSLGQGVAVLVGAVIVYALTLRTTDASTARAMVFATIVTGNIGLILVNRSRHGSIVSALRARNPAFWWLMGAALGGLLAVLYVPSLAGLFRFSPPDVLQLAAAVAAAIAALAGYELLWPVAARVIGHSLTASRGGRN